MGGPDTVNWKHEPTDTGEASTASLPDGRTATIMGEHSPGESWSVNTDVYDPKTDTHSVENETYDIQKSGKAPQRDTQRMYAEAYHKALEKAAQTKPVTVNGRSFSYNDVQYAMNMAENGAAQAGKVQQGRPAPQSAAQQQLSQVDPKTLYSALEQWRQQNVGKKAVDREYNNMLANNDMNQMKMKQSADGSWQYEHN
jgi:hypothetical protein